MCVFFLSLSFFSSHNSQRFFPFFAFPFCFLQLLDDFLFGFPAMNAADGNSVPKTPHRLLVEKAKLAHEAVRAAVPDEELTSVLRRAEETLNPCIFSVPLQNGQSIAFASLCPEIAPLMDATARWSKLQKLLHEAVSHLTPREQQIMEMRFGLKGGREKTQKEVADEIGISQSYISRLEKRIRKQLREELERVCN